MPSAEEIAPPLHWPSLTPAEAEAQWPQLAAWVDALRARFEDCDTHVVPRCWYLHPSIVGALQALRDHERVSYSSKAPGASGTDWHRAYRDITGILKLIVAKLKCEREHVAPIERPATDPDAFHKFMTDDVAQRRQLALQRAMQD
jgi:hypothetical protein